jgi:CheY-like chemotaxis protein
MAQPQDPQHNGLEVLVIGDEPSARNAVRILLGSAGCRCTIVSSLQEALSLIEKKGFDAIVLDPQSSGLQAGEAITRIGEIHPHLLERIVVITDEAGNSVVQNLVDRYACLPVQRKCLVQQLWAGVQSLLRPQPVLSRLSHTARLIFDSFQAPPCAGVRNAQSRSRHLLYAAGTLRVDLWIETQAGPDRVALTGQILDAATPDRAFSSVPVALLGCKGSVAETKANEFGEFHLEFSFEPRVNLDIKIGPTYLVTLSLPKDSLRIIA